MTRKLYTRLQVPYTMIGKEDDSFGLICHNWLYLSGLSSNPANSLRSMAKIFYEIYHRSIVFGLVMPRSNGPKTRRATKFYLQADLQNICGRIFQSRSYKWVGKRGLRVQLLRQMAEVLLQLTSRAGEVVNLTNYFAKRDSSATEGERVHHSGHKRRHSWKY